MSHLGKWPAYNPWQTPASGGSAPAGLVLFEYEDNLVFERETLGLRMRSVTAVEDFLGRAATTGPDTAK